MVYSGSGWKQTRVDTVIHLIAKIWRLSRLPRFLGSFNSLVTVDNPAANVPTVWRCRDSGLEFRWKLSPILEQYKLPKRHTMFVTFRRSTSANSTSDNSISARTGPPGLAHDSPRTPNAHISLPRRFKHHQNSTKGPQERERRKNIVAGGGEKSAKFWAPPPFGAPPFWAPPFFCAPPFWAPPFGAPPFGAPPFGAPLFLGLGPPPFGAPPFGPTFSRFGASTLWATHPSGLHPLAPPFEGPTLCRPKIQHPKIGRSRNWPKSNWPNSKKKAGRSRNWPKSIALD